MFNKKQNPAVFSVILTFVSCLTILPSAYADTTPVVPTPVNMGLITYSIPEENGLIPQKGTVENITFPNLSRYSTGQREILSATRTNDSSIMIERRTETETGVAGSGKRLRVDFSVEKFDAGYKVIFNPVEYSTYQQGWLMPFPVPKFDDADTFNYLLNTSLNYKIEVDSEFNPESTYANFARILKARKNTEGQKDLVTGKIFKQQFVLPYRDKEVLFGLETFPYRNGSKAVMYLKIPATFTSPNTVDYKIIIDEVRAKLTEIVKA